MNALVVLNLKSKKVKITNTLNKHHFTFVMNAIY